MKIRCFLRYIRGKESRVFVRKSGGKEEKSERKKEEEFRQKKLYELYIDFCSGRIRLEQFAERARSVLDKMPDHPVRNRIYDLMKLHLDILCGKEDLKEHIPEDAKKESLEICQGYVWYLQACYDKEDDTIDEAREEMKTLCFVLKAAVF